LELFLFAANPLSDRSAQLHPSEPPHQRGPAAPEWIAAQSPHPHVPHLPAAYRFRTRPRLGAGANPAAASRRV